VARASPTGDLGNYVFQDTTHWWSVQDSTLFKTTDAGRTWTVTGAEPRSLILLRVLDDRHAWAEMDDGYGTELALTADGGLHWTRTNVPNLAMTGPRRV